MTYDRIVSLMHGHEIKKLENNTWAIKRHVPESIDVTYHGYTIAIWYPDPTGPGHVWLSNCGFWTSTTKLRLNNYGPDRMGLYQHKFAWYTRDGKEFTNGHTYFADDFTS